MGQLALPQLNVVYTTEKKNKYISHQITILLKCPFRNNNKNEILPLFFPG